MYGMSVAAAAVLGLFSYTYIYGVVVVAASLILCVQCMYGASLRVIWFPCFNSKVGGRKGSTTCSVYIYTYALLCLAERGK